MIRKVPKELRPVVEEAIGRGCWELCKAPSPRAAHRFRLVHTSGRTVALTNTRVSDHRVVKNLRADLLRIEKMT